MASSEPVRADAGGNDTGRLCVCLEQGREHCRGLEHECTCAYPDIGGPALCLGAEHECSCVRKDRASCRAAGAHRCSCYEQGGALMECDAPAHRCICWLTADSAAVCPGATHVCVCRDWGPELCRRGGPASGHEGARS